jgi:branched-chain amino acid transport system ATP-binding protein
MLKLENVHTYYGKSHVLHGVSMEVKEGEVVGILGRNGVGKTTTMRTIMGLTPPKEGVIELNGVNIAGMPAYKIARLGIGYVPQGRHVFPELTVMENLKIGMREERPELFEDVFSLFPRLEERKDQLAGTMSGGEQQMLAIARALMVEPKIILMDEPTEGLMPIMVSKIMEVIHEINEKGVSILLVEQNAKMALDTVERVYIMEKGTIKHESTSEKLKENSEVLVRYLGVKT